jgi:hypothetical protein
MARNRDSDYTSARNYAAGQKKPSTGTGAAGQNVASGNAPEFVSDIVSGAKDIGQKIFDGISGGAGDLMSNLRGKNLPGKGGNDFAAKAPASFAVDVEDKDWRVKLSVPPSLGDTSGLLNPLFIRHEGHMVFPYTPTIIVSHSAAYNTVSPIHNNYPFFAYQNSQVDAMTIVGQFYCQDSVDAQYWTSCLHYLRTMTKMDYGSKGSGAPPPIAKLNGYGDYVFNNVPVIIQNFTVDMPNEVDYIACGFTPGDLAAMGEFGGSRKFGWAPSESQFSITVQPIYSRNKQTNFSYKDFINGSDIGKGYI